MPHFEALDARTLFATSGSGPSFGTDGRVKLPGSISPTVLAAGGSIYVAAYTAVSRGRYAASLYKYTDAGTPDTSFGTGGKVSLAVPAAQAGDAGVALPLTLAYDARTGKVYAGQIVSHPAGEKTATGQRTASQQTLLVRRFDAKGKADTAYGDAGTFVYGADPYTGPAGYSEAITVRRLLPLSNGRLLVAMERTESQDNLDNANRKVTGLQDVALMRVRDNGRRDSTFGRGGVVGVNRASSTKTSNDLSSSFSGTELAFGDVRVGADGGYRVIDTGRRATRTVTDTGPTTDQASLHAVTFADATTLDASGRVDADAGFRATVVRENTDRVDSSKLVEFRTVLAVAEGDAVLLAGVNAAPGAKVFRLTAANRVVSDLALPRNARTGGAVRGDDGVTFFFSTKGVTRFHADLTLDKTWGTGGTSARPGGVTFAVDAKDRLLFADDDLGRTDGTSA